MLPALLRICIRTAIALLLGSPEALLPVTLLPVTLLRPSELGALLSSFCSASCAHFITPGLFLWRSSVPLQSSQAPASRARCCVPRRPQQRQPPQQMAARP